MKKEYIGITLVLIIFISVLLWVERGAEIAPIKTSPSIPKQGDFVITSSAFDNDGNIPSDFTCDGRVVHPPLAIANVPQDSKSLTLILTDPDAPMGTFIHWTVWNISPEITEIAADTLPEKSVEGGLGYIPPCPPSGIHRYFFELYALDTVLGLNGQANISDLERAMQGHIVAQTKLIGRYGRK